MSSEAEVSDAVQDVLALIHLDRLEPVRMSAYYDVCTVIDQRAAPAYLALCLLVFCFDAPVA